jgi:hypothetical protein
MRQTLVLSATTFHVPSRNSAKRFFSGLLETAGEFAMTPYLDCGSAVAGICFAIAVWRLNASRSPDQAYRAAAAAGMSGLIVVGLALTWLLL